MQNALVQADASIGRHCIINSGASVDHECRIGDFVHISPHATPFVAMSMSERDVDWCPATVIPGIKIGKWCTIGAGLL